MEFFVGLDVSLETTSICVIDERGVIVKEGKAASDPFQYSALRSASGPQDQACWARSRPALRMAVCRADARKASASPSWKAVMSGQLLRR